MVRGVGVIAACTITASAAKGSARCRGSSTRPGAAATGAADDRVAALIDAGCQAGGHSAGEASEHSLDRGGAAV